MKRKFSRLFLERLEDRCVPSTRTWTGNGANDLWSNPANWDGGVSAPANGDDVAIPDVAGSNEVVFDNSVAGAALSLNSLSCDEPFRIMVSANTSATLTLATAGTFSFNNAVTISGGTLNANGTVSLNSSLAQSGGTLGGSGSVTVAGLITWSGGTMSGGGVTNANGGLMLSGTPTSTRTINNAGAASYDGVGNTNFAAGTFNNLAGGTFTITGNNDIGGTAFNNQGRFVKRAGASGDGSTRFTGAFNNSGAVSVESGTLSLEGSGTSTGDLDALAGTTLRFAGGGIHNFNGGADIMAAGVVLFSSASPSGVNFNAGSTYTVTGTTQITSGVNNFNVSATTSTLALSGGTLGGAGTFTVTGLTTWSGGTMTGGGVTNANGGLNMTGNVPNSRTINNPAVATYVGVDNNNLGGGTFNNLAGATFTVEGNNDFFGGTFNNFGTLVKRAGASGDGVTRFTAALNNSGLVSLESGTLSLEGSDTSTGDLDALAGTTLQFTSVGIHNFTTGADVTVAGLVLHAGASPGGVNFNAGSTYSVTGTTQITGGGQNFSGSATTAQLLMSGGTLGGSGAFNVGGPTTWSGGTMGGTGVTNANGGLIMTGIVTNSRTINNAGVATYNGTANNTLGGGTFNNLSTGSFTLDGNNDFAGGTFNNQGTFIKRAGTGGDGVTRFFAALNNSGRVDLQSGTLSLERDDTSTGDIDTQIGSTLQFVGDGVHAFNAGAAVTARGLVIVATSFNGSTAFGAANFFGGSTYTATGTTQILSGSVRFFDMTANLSTLDMSGGEQAGNGTINVSGPTTWSGGAMRGAGVTNLNGGVVMTGTLFLTGGRTLNNPAIATYNGVANNAVDNNAAGTGGTFNNLATGTFIIDGNNDWRSGSSFNNLGTFIKRAGASGDGVTTFGSAFNNSGVVDLQSGTLSCQAGIVASGLYQQTAGTTILDGGTLAGTSININGGSLVGSGTIVGNLTNIGGQIRPGAGPGPSTGAFAITGSYNQGLAGALNIEIGGPSGSQIDQLNVAGAVGVVGAGINGALNVNLVGGYVPSLRDTFAIISNDGTDPIVGTFAGLAEGATFVVGGALFRISYVGGTGNDVVLSVITPPNTPPSNLMLTPSASAINEGGTVTLNGSFTDPDAGDTHTVVINWGPGEGITTLNLAAGVLNFAANHQYLDDNPGGTATDSYPISVTVSDDDAGSGSASTSATVNNVAPVVTISGPASGADFPTGTPITFAGTFSDAGTADTHTAQWLFDSVTSAGTVIESGGSGTVGGSYTFTAPGVYTVKLTVTDDDGGASSDQILVTILRRPTATSVSSSTDPSVFGQAATFTATVTEAGGSGVPSGTVQFRVDGSDFGGPVSLVSGMATVSSSGLPAGPHTITAVYSGDATFATSTSDALTQTVNPAATATAATVSAPTPLFGVDGVTVTANVSVVSPGSGSASGTVTFFDGAAVLGTVDLVSGAASLSLGSSALTAGPHAIRTVYSGDGNFMGSDLAVSINVLAPSAIQGLVYVDLDNDGQVDLGERAVAGVTVTLAGTDDLGHSVSRTVQTDINGVYVFLNLRPSNAAGYTVTETQPAELLDGRDTLGTVNGVPTGSAAVNDAFSAIALPQGGSLAENYNFGEQPLATGGVVPGQTATIGYWQNRNGQNLLRSLNGGPTATQLGHWLAANFPTMYAALDGMTNADVAAYYKTLFARTSQTAPGGPPKMDCQAMATAFAVYVTTQGLAGTTASTYGFQVSATGLGTRTFNVGSDGAAFGLANNVVVSVMDLLLAVNARSRNGLLYDLNGDGRIDGSEVGYRTMANDVFTAINEAGDI